MESEKRMETKTYKSIYDMADDMCELALDNKYIVAALFYEDAAELLKALLSLDQELGIKVDDIVLERPEFNLYNKEYYISLTGYDGELSLTIEPAFSDNRYLSSECDILLIDGDASSSIILKHEESECYEVSIWESDYKDDIGFTCEGDCQSCGYIMKQIYATQLSLEIMIKLGLI